jgi:uncharacterized protein YdaU (DUF1376 family)
MAKSPAFQFYPKDWLSSPKVQLMTPEQEGAYVRLLCYCWDSGDCSIPDNDDELAVLSRLGEGWFKGGSGVVRRCFVPHPRKPGYLTNERLLEEAEKQDAWRQKSSAGGKQSAEKRKKLKGGSTNRQPDTPPTVEPKANSSSSSASSSEISNTRLLTTPRDDGGISPLERSMTVHPRFEEVRKEVTRRWPHLGRQNASEVNEWLKEGAEPEADIYPTLDHVHSVRGGDIGSFRYFTRQILSAVQVRKEQDAVFDRLTGEEQADAEER